MLGNIVAVDVMSKNMLIDDVQSARVACFVVFCIIIMILASMATESTAPILYWTKVSVRIVANKSPKYNPPRSYDGSMIQLMH